MRTLACFCLLLSILAPIAHAETFTAWVSESWKAQTTNWTVQVMDGDGMLVGKDSDATALDLGEGSGASVSGTVVTTNKPNQWVTVQIYDSDVPDYAAAVVPYYLGAGGVKAEPTAPIYADTQQIRNTDLPAVKSDTGSILADTNEMQTDQASGGRLDTVWQNTATTADNIFTDTQALIAGVNVTQIAGADAMAQLGVGVWDALTVNHQVAGSFGLAVLSGGTPTDIASAVWDAATADYAQTNTFGLMIQDIAAAVTGINLQFDYAAPDNIATTRTLFIVGTASTSIAQINTFTSGVVTLACDCDNVNTLNPGTTITNVVSATVTADADGSLTATSDLRIQQNRRKANFSIDPITSAGWHTCTVTVNTSDGQTIAYTGKLQVK